jgi:outer membrane protein insertion porin family
MADTRVVSEIAVSPPDAISLGELKSIVDIREGFPYSRKALKDGIKLLYLKGRFSDIRVDAEESEGKVRLTFYFTLKERVGRVSFSGNKGIATRRLNDLLTIEEWDELSLDSIRKQGEAVEEFYRKRGYFRCDVEFRLHRSPGKREVDIEYVIEEGDRAPLSQVFFTGNRAFSEKELQEALPFKKGELYEEAAVLKGVKGIKKAYMGMGYSEVRVDFKPNYDPNRNDVTLSININEGEIKGEEVKVRIEEVTFKGNTAIGSGTLGRQMLTGRVFSEETLSADIDAIEFFYRKSGYLSARVVEKEVTYSEDGRSVWIELTISEGPQTIIKGMDVEGNYLFGRDEILREVGLKTGTPFDPWALDEGIIRISSLYSQKGYIYARVSHREEFTDDKRGVILRIAIIEGIQVRVGKIIIRGNDFTEDKVIRRELLIRPGDVYNPETIFKSQQRVYRLGFLSGVRLSPIDEDVMEEEKDLLLSVKERKAGALEFGAGYGTEERFRGFAELSHRNLYGTGASARLRGDISQLESSYLLGFRKPWLFDYPVDGRFSLVDQVTRRESYSLEKYAATVGVDKDLTEFIKGSLQYEYEISRLFDVEERAKIAPEDEGTLDIGTISPIIIRDSRDNPFNPKTGSVNSLKVDYSAGMSTGSEVEFVRYIVQSSWYRPLSERVVGAFSVRGGWADAYGETKEIPISKRFFLGGRTTVRGFELDSIGPKGPDGSPIGGDAYINLNAEFRFPLYKRIGGLVFTDAGNVWLKSEERVNVMDLRSSAGIGLRYMTPIGPLSLDAGWKLDRKREESAWEWHFTIGNVF